MKMSVFSPRLELHVNDLPLYISISKNWLESDLWVGLSVTSFLWLICPVPFSLCNKGQVCCLFSANK